MAKNTKINLNNSKVIQNPEEILDLLGINYIKDGGVIIIESSGEIQLKGNNTDGAFVRSDSEGRLYNDEINFEDYDPEIIGEKQIFDVIGDDSTTSFTFNHGKGTRNVMVQVFRDEEPYNTVHPGIGRPTTDTIEIVFEIPPVTGENFKVFVLS